MKFIFFIASMGMTAVIYLIGSSLVISCDTREPYWKEVNPLEIGMQYASLAARRECTFQKYEGKCNDRSYRIMCEVKPNEINLYGKIKDLSK